MHQHDNTNQIIQEIFKLITSKIRIPPKKVKKLFIQGDPLITEQFWTILNSKYRNQYTGVSHCPGCDKFHLEPKPTLWKMLISALRL